MAATSDCLNDETLLGFLHGRLDDRSLAKVESHALACQACEELIAAGLAAGSYRRDLWSEGGEAMGRPELSCRFLVPFLDLAAENVPPSEISRFVSLWRTSIAELSDEAGWVSRRFCEALSEWLADKIGVDAIIERILRDSYSPKTMGILYPFVRALGSPRVGFSRFPSLVRLLNRASDVEVRMHGRNQATVIYRPKSEATRERSPLICRVRRAQIAAGPTIWNLPQAAVEEAECQALGGDRCVYRVTWVEPTRWWQSLVGGLALGAAAWLASGHNWLVSIFAMAAAVAGVHLWGARRDLREMRALEDLKMNMLGRVKRLRLADAADPSRREMGMAEALLGEGRVGAPEVGIAPLPQTGQLLAGRYRLGPLLGAGGMGFVFSASDEATDQVIALKVLRPELSVNPRWVERMEREVRIARTIRDPNVCQVMSFGQVDGYSFLTMELAGGSLHDELRGHAAARPWAARAADAKAIVRGLVAIHRAGIVHRDLTPQNILRFAEGRLAIADFGLAVDKPGKTTQIAGTPSYIAPEVLAGGKVSYASDVWQLGMILRELLFGDSVDSAATEETSRAARALLKLCADCMIVDPRLRPENAQAVATRFPSFAEA